MSTAPIHRHDDGGISPARRNFMVVMLVITGVISYIDRQILPVLLESIKHDLVLSDTQMGLLTGVFFSAFFAISGIPLARVADRGNRRWLITLCLASWSAATAICGLAQNYAQLAAGRAMVAVGEAGAAPAGSSIISDLFRPTQRARIFAFISCGSAVGLGFGVFLAGRLNEMLGWRNVFLVVGLPGILFALLFFLTVKEPVRPVRSDAERVPLSFTQSLGTFIGLSSYRWVAVVTVMASLGSYAVLGWMPAFLIRVHGLSHAEVGVQLGTAIMVGLLVGNLSCAWIAPRLAARDVRWLSWLPAIGLFGTIPFGLAMLFAESTATTLVLLAICMSMFGFWSPPVNAIAVGLVDSRSRALIASTIPILQAIGGALGPFLVGYLNDFWAADMGAEAIRYSMATSFLGCLIGGVIAASVGGLVRRDFRLDPGEAAAIGH